MNKMDTILFTLLCCLVVILVAFSNVFKEETFQSHNSSIAHLVESELDPNKVMDAIGIPFAILKTNSFGKKTLHKFYCISTSERLEDQRVRNLSDALIKEIISAKPESFHTLTFHFILGEELKKTVESSSCYARVSFLPHGKWEKAGRVPIDDYKDYSLICSFPE